MHYYDDDDNYWSGYYTDYYQKSECEYGCPPHTHCEWGLCECDTGYYKSWGTCRQAEEHIESKKGGQPANRTEGGICSNLVDCSMLDINMVCRSNNCLCRRDMKWNPKALECQLFIDVDCRNLTYSSPVHPVIAEAAEKMEEERTPDRGFTTEEDLKNKILNLPIVLDATKIYGNFSMSMMYLADMIELNEGGTSTRFCTYLDWKGPGRCSLEKLAEMLRKPHKTDHEIPKNRTETPEEGLEGSLLEFVITNSTNLTQEVMDEAFCRDMESYSEALQFDGPGRPAACNPVKETLCAMLYDSSTCASGSWELEVPDGTQRRLEYFSSDWKYRMMQMCWE